MKPIETAPKDITILLRFEAMPMYSITEPTWIEGWWFSSPKEIDDGWETYFGFVGEPTHWAPMPETDEGI